MACRAVFADDPSNREKTPPPLKTRGIVDPSTYCGHCGLVGDSGLTGRRFKSALCRNTLTFPPVVHDWVTKGLGMSSCVCATGRPHPRPPPPTSNYRVPPAHRFHKYKLRLLYFRMQKLTPYSIKFIEQNSGRACPQTLLGRHCADGARPPPPQPINDPPPSLVNPGYRPDTGLMVYWFDGGTHDPTPPDLFDTTLLYRTCWAVCTGLMSP